MTNDADHRRPMNSNQPQPQARQHPEERDHEERDPAEAALTVYYDGACPVCSKEIALYRRQPGAQACRWIDASACPDEALGDGLSRADALARFHVRRRDGALVGGMRGFATLWQTLPRTAWLGRVAAFGPMPFVLEGGYRVFLRLRALWRPAAPGAARRGAGRRVD